MKYLEIGCAPWKLLAWVAKILQAEVSGLDYSANGIRFAQLLFERLNISADLRCEDLTQTTFAPESLDFVFINGLIEHFDDPREIVRQHVHLAKPGGTVLVLIPNYTGIYGRLLRRFDPKNIEIHNLTIMNPPALAALAPRDLVSDVAAYRTGRAAPGLVCAEQVFPRIICQGMTLAVTAFSFLQPFDMPALCPNLALEMKRTKG